ncbi:hypothetical protein MIMGU_mgv11b020521mg, partial [Erythranthe guttata]
VPDSVERERLRTNERRRARYASKKRARLFAPTPLVPSPLASSSSAFGNDVPDSEERKRLCTNERRRDRYASKKRSRLFAPTLLVPSPLPSSSSAFANGANAAADPQMTDNRCVSRNKNARARYASMDTARKDVLLMRVSNRKAALRAAKFSNIQTKASAASSSASIVTPAAHSESFVSPLSIEQFKGIQSVYQSPWFLPKEDICEYCGAYRFYRECAGFCCASGQILFPKSAYCPIMWFLFTSVESELAVEFRRRVRSYNGAFAFTSIGMTIDENSRFADLSKMLQLFFLDTADNLSNEMLEKKEFRRDIMSLLIDALSINSYAVFFKRLSTWENLSDAYIVLRSDSVLDQRTYNLPTVDQVAAVWKDGDRSGTGLERDIRVFTKSGASRIISYYYGCYDTLQYPLLFTRGEPGWHAGIGKLCFNRIGEIARMFHVDNIIVTRRK